jgi:hypothetical protein
MSNIIIDSEGMLFFAVDKESNNIMKHDVFTLFKVWHDEEDWQSKVIKNEAELIQAKNEKNIFICLSLGRLDASMILPCIPEGRWNNADTIVHEGFVYVKANDLLFCNKNLEM